MAFPVDCPLHGRSRIDGLQGGFQQTKDDASAKGIGLDNPLVEM
jgi:hypothetical protein